MHAESEVRVAGGSSEDKKRRKREDRDQPLMG